MASVKQLNAKAEVMGRQAALFMNINAAKGLLDVMKTNLGPKGTIKMLVGGAGGAPDQIPFFFFKSVQPLATEEDYVYGANIYLAVPIILLIWA